MEKTLWQAVKDCENELYAVPYAADLRVEFRGLMRRTGVLLHGPAGWAEFSPFDNYDDQVASRWLEAALENAVWPYPASQRTEIPINATVPACGPQRAWEIARQGACQTAKVKVAEPSQQLSDDIARLEAVRDALGTQAKIRIDVNAAWSAEEAIKRIPILERAAGGLEYVEQPCFSLEEMALVRRVQDVPIAADESIRLSADPRRVLEAEAADILVVKVQPLRGIRPCLQLVEELGGQAVVSSAVETSVGIAQGLALAAALPNLPYACGIGTVNLIVRDVVNRPLRPVDGYLTAGRVKVSEQALWDSPVTAEENEYWQRRLASTCELLGVKVPLWRPDDTFMGMW